ncbi:Zn-ribbon domain-containing OB-fold protein [Streptomyces sp. OE57]|uniref:Zn-ribbon domain-containing OB-fold protein n=1 Tax=Streptomyces lacaronensis TaxID=3379885 RepID=UPI0039B7259B
MSHTVIETAGNGPFAGDGASTAASRNDPDQRSGLISAGGIRDGALYFQRCRWCHTAVFRRLLCPVCGSTDMAEERSDGTGVIHHVTVVGRGAGRPRAMAIIDMHEGFRLRARVSAVPLARACVGAQVRLGFGPEPQEIAFQLCD